MNPPFSVAVAAVDLADLRARGHELSERALEVRWGLSRRKVREVLGRSASSQSPPEDVAVDAPPPTAPAEVVSPTGEALDRWITGCVAEEGGTLPSGAYQNATLIALLHAALGNDRQFLARYGYPTKGEIRSSLRRLAP